MFRLAERIAFAELPFSGLFLNLVRLVRYQLLQTVLCLVESWIRTGPGQGGSIFRFSDTCALWEDLFSGLSRSPCPRAIGNGEVELRIDEEFVVSAAGGKDGPLDSGSHGGTRSGLIEYSVAVLDCS
jgi:hypothetical protein